MSDAFDISSATGSGPLGQVANIAGQVAGEALQGPALQGAMNEALSGMGDMIQHLVDGALPHAAETAGEMAGHAAEALPFDAAHEVEWNVVQANMAEAAETLDAVQDHAMQLMASPNPADQLEGQALMQQAQQQTEAILEVLHGQGEAMQSILENLHGDAGLEALPLEVALADHADGAWADGPDGHDAGPHDTAGHDADHVDAAPGDSGVHHDDAVAADVTAHDAAGDYGDATA